MQKSFSPHIYVLQKKKYIICFTNYKQLIHLFLRTQEIMVFDLKASKTNCELVSNQRLCQPFEKAIFMAKIAAMSSAT